MTDKDLKEVLRLHKDWVAHKEHGVRADLSHMDLSYANLSGINLHSAILIGTNLIYSNLSNADLSDADMHTANLFMANLSRAVLRGAHLSMANMANAKLIGTNLKSANMYGACLTNAKFSQTSISWNSHELISEILFQSAGQDVDRRSIAGLVRMSHDWCWETFLAIEHPAKQWALEVLETYLLPVDTCYWKDIIEKR